MPDSTDTTSCCVECGTEVQGIPAVIAIRNDYGGQTFEVLIYECPLDLGYFWYVKMPEPTA